MNIRVCFFLALCVIFFLIQKDRCYLIIQYYTTKLFRTSSTDSVRHSNVKHHLGQNFLPSASRIYQDNENCTNVIFFPFISFHELRLGCKLHSIQHFKTIQKSNSQTKVMVKYNENLPV